MWGIENPWKTFDYIYQKKENTTFNFMCIINKTKWNSFSNTSELEKLALINKQFSIVDVEIKDPDNPASLKEAKEKITKLSNQYNLQAKLIKFYLQGEKR